MRYMLHVYIAFLFDYLSQWTLINREFTQQHTILLTLPSYVILLQSCIAIFIIHPVWFYPFIIYTLHNLSVLGLCLRINDWFVCLYYSDCFVSDLFYWNQFTVTLAENSVGQYLPQPYVIRSKSVLVCGEIVLQNTVLVYSWDSNSWIHNCHILTCIEH